MGIEEIDRGPAAAIGAGESGFSGTGKINDNFTILDERTNKSNPIITWFLQSDFTISNTVTRLIAALNSLPTKTIQQGVSYHFFERRVVGDVGIATQIDATYYDTYYALQTQIGDSETVGLSGSFVFTNANLRYGTVGNKTTVLGTGGTVDYLDIGNVGVVSIEAAVNAHTPAVTINEIPFLIVGNDGTNNFSYFYTGNETTLGDGSTTVLGDYQLITNDPTPDNTVDWNGVSASTKQQGFHFVRNDETSNGAFLGVNDILKKVLVALGVPYVFDDVNANWYEQESDLFIGQANQVTDKLYYVSDTDTIYRYLGTTNGDATDYEDQNLVAAAASTEITVFGNVFNLRKSNTNPGTGLETGDFILNGENYDGTEFWGAAKYIGTDPSTDKDLPESWNPLFRSKL